MLKLYTYLYMYIREAYLRIHKCSQVFCQRIVAISVTWYSAICIHHSNTRSTFTTIITINLIDYFRIKTRSETSLAQIGGDKLSHTRRIDRRKESHTHLHRFCLLPVLEEVHVLLSIALSSPTIFIWRLPIRRERMSSHRLDKPCT